jgi:hypothetical protein
MKLKSYTTHVHVSAGRLTGASTACSCAAQDKLAEMHARRKRMLSTAQSARIRKGMMRYMVLVRRCTR